MAVDKPTVHLSLVQLRKEVVAPDAFRIALSNSKTITFPDLYAMESTEAETIFENLNSNATNWAVLAQWLAADDVAALKAEKLSLAQLVHVVKAAVGYYEGIYGKPGEGAAS
ncbi:hypothetical protein [Arthrobacter sp. MDT1-65]